MENFKTTRRPPFAWIGCSARGFRDLTHFSTPSCICAFVTTLAAQGISKLHEGPQNYTKAPETTRRPPETTRRPPQGICENTLRGQIYGEFCLKIHEGPSRFAEETVLNLFPLDPNRPHYRPHQRPANDSRPLLRTNLYPFKPPIPPPSPYLEVYAILYRVFREPEDSLRLLVPEQLLQLPPYGQFARPDVLGYPAGRQNLPESTRPMRLEQTGYC